ncbi:high frequency lysogenization protein HflD [Candidatus Methylomicrobium oryzae]|jgi:high frequency lysogenization protein|uniref:high frequency lysogenization protein HflD n=1 Tax=Candidatus Methylomicrobium oryzae TaxID=2802053 RepID=UPI0019221F8D|nr:high frequency lysogenization protein HflD [Methylomicrobium sp. RS1]MBL1262828.1 high frequency lysogenization protein HflD [Methylomicrobium sp. RS1]
MELKTLTNQTIALAGVAQAAALVQQLATRGTCDQEALNASIGSVLKIDSESVLDVYGGLNGLKLGLRQLQSQMTGYRVDNPEQARYAATLVFLENQLSSRKDLLDAIRVGVEKAQAQSEHFGLLHENVLANLGEVYHSTVSTLQPRIMVNGEQTYLSRPDTVNKIRALLLAGIRSVILWKQCGGARWKFIFYRKKIQKELENLLQQV